MKRNSSLSNRRRQAGQSMVEYFVVASFAILVLIQGGDSAPVQQVVTAIKQAYLGFTYSLSFATNLNLL